MEHTAPFVNFFECPSNTTLEMDEIGKNGFACRYSDQFPALPLGQTYKSILGELYLNTKISHII